MILQNTLRWTYSEIDAFENFTCFISSKFLSLPNNKGNTCCLIVVSCESPKRCVSVSFHSCKVCSGRLVDSNADGGFLLASDFPAQMNAVSIV